MKGIGERGSDREGRTEAQTYRAPMGIIVLVIGSALGGYLLIDAVVRGSWAQMLLFAPWVLLVLWLIHVVSVASMVRVDDEGVIVQNLLRRTSFGWRPGARGRSALAAGLHARRRPHAALLGRSGPDPGPADEAVRRGVGAAEPVQALTDVRARWDRAVRALRTRSGARMPERPAGLRTPVRPAGLRTPVRSVAARMPRSAAPGTGPPSPRSR